jgi:RNA polymerase sigma factor (sigma-70 family)
MRELGLEELLRLSAGGNLAAWGLVVQDHRPLVFDFHLGVTGDSHDADDLTQRTFERALTHLPARGFKASFQRWLLGVAYNVGRKEYTRRNKVEWEPLSPTLMSEEPSPAERAEASDDRLYVWAAAKALLFPRDYEIFCYHYGEGLTPAQIAEGAGISRQQVHVALYRGRQTLLALRNL